jgi:hypothetical protein
MKEFYVPDQISNIMPGSKDYVSVNSEGKKVHLYTYIPCNLKKKTNYNLRNRNLRNARLFKVCRIKAKKYVLDEATGMRAVCVCNFH